MAAKPHAVRNGYIALVDVDDANLKCWKGDVVDVPDGWIERLTRLGVISPDVRPAGYGDAPPAVTVPAPLPVTPEPFVPEPSPSVPDLPPDEPAPDGDAADGVADASDDDGVADGDWRDTVQLSAPAAPRKRGRPRKAPATTTE